MKWNVYKMNKLEEALIALYSPVQVYC